MTPARNYSFGLYVVNQISTPKISRIFLRHSSIRHMKSIKAGQLSKIQYLVPNNPGYDRATKDPEEVAAERRAIKKTLYDSSYRTATGHWKRRDEPDEAEQLKQSDRIRKHLLAKQQQASRERLKSKGVVPTKQGKKLFDEFIKEANAHRPSRGKTRINTRDLNDL